MNDQTRGDETRPDETRPPAATGLAYAWRLGLSLAIGTAGGAAFFRLGLPLPWMLGAMCFSLVAALAKLPIVPTRRIRPYVVIVIGVTLGSAFAPGLLAHLGGWVPVLVGVVLATLVMQVVGTLYLSKVAGFDRTTAYFAAAPGGIYEMSQQGAKAGADEQRILIVQAIRIFLVVLCIPISLRVLGFVGPTNGILAGAGAATARDMAVLVACGVLGWPMAQVLRLPNPPLIGPMILSAAVHLTSVTAVTPPYVLVCLAQVCLGTSLGGQFIGFPLASLMRVARHAMAVFALAIIVCAAAAGGAAHVLDRSFAVMTVTFAPAGIAEMALVAMAMQADVAMVTVSQLARILLVQFVVPPVFAMLSRRSGPE